MSVLPEAKSPFHHWAHALIRLSKSPAVTISAIRERARAAGRELAPATDIRCASRERAILGQFEVGFATLPAAVPQRACPASLSWPSLRDSARRRRLHGDRAEQYGYVNRAVPDDEFEAFVDSFAARVSRFDLLALRDIKRMVNAASLPPDDALLSEMDALVEAFARPATPSIIEQAMQDGLQQHGEIELN